MAPSRDDIATFITFAPDAGEAKATKFLESAHSVEEAVSQFYENPDKYSPVSSDAKAHGIGTDNPQDSSQSPPPYAPQTLQNAGIGARHNSVSGPQYAHTNAVIKAGHVRARDEQEMQGLLQQVQFQMRIYNSEIEPEHDTDYYCSCAIHQLQRRKMRRLNVQEMWSSAVMYPGEKSYHNCYQGTFFSRNPYRFRVISPYGLAVTSSFYGATRPIPKYHAQSIHQTISMNATLNAQAQAAVDALEPKFSIWEIEQLESSMSSLSVEGDQQDQKRPIENGSSEKKSSEKWPAEKGSSEKRKSIAFPSSASSSSAGPSSTGGDSESSKSSRFGSLKKAFFIKSTEERSANKESKAKARVGELRNSILQEEHGRWPDQEWRQIVANYQEKVGMTQKIANLRARSPIQYLHLLRAGYFEPIPVAWADLASNPLKFSIEEKAGWRGITPTWRGYEDTAEERLYWVLNHREGSLGARLKPDMISAMNMARARMASAVEPPPAYFSSDDTCHLQHTSDGYSKQVMPPPFRPYDAPETSADETMILLDVSGSMDFEPVRPIYDQYLITGYAPSTQPKNKDVAKAIIRRFTDAVANHDHNFSGYQLTTFANHAKHIGVINHRNLDEMWRNVSVGGGTRVMTGWQKVKQLHFTKHHESATYHPVYGWQAGPQTPMLRLLLLLDGEATDMDEFELDLLSLSWVHVTIFLIGVDGCPHHHRHANELSRISEVNHHVSFVDAQGNTPERFVTHELLKRHLGYDVSMSEFEQLEQPPPYAV